MMKHDPLCALLKKETCSGIGGLDWSHYTDRDQCRNCGKRCDCARIAEIRAALAAEPDEAAEKALAVVIAVAYDLHPVYGSTATWHGGMGGAAMTQGCSIIDTPPGHAKALEAVEIFWRQVHQSIGDEAVERVAAYRKRLLDGEDIR